MKENKNMQLEKAVQIIIPILSVLIGVYFQRLNTEQSTFYFLALLFAVAAFFIVSYPINVFKNRMEQVDKNTKDLRQLRENLNDMKNELVLTKKMENIDARLSVIEKHDNRKGQVDPRWVLIIIILIILYMYLRSIGVAPV